MSWLDVGFREANVGCVFLVVSHMPRKATVDLEMSWETRGCWDRGMYDTYVSWVVVAFFHCKLLHVPDVKSIKQGKARASLRLVSY